MSMNRSVERWLLIIPTVTLLGIAAASTSRASSPAVTPDVVQGQPQPPPHELGPSELPAPDAPHRVQPPLPPERLRRGPYQSVQVNVDAGGNDIIGDAANEPTIAVDPTNPNHIVIGWRQFNSVTSSFRQAGWAYSRDGGATWTFPGVIQPGVFRSDPVLDADANGNFYYNSLHVAGSNYSCDVYKSTNGGTTWGSGVSAFGGDKQWMIIDKTDGIGRGNIYAFWSASASSCGISGNFTRSYNGGQSFLDCTRVLGSPFWGTLAVGPDGELYVCGDGFTVTKSSTIQDPGDPVAWDFTRSVILNGSMLVNADPNPGGLGGQVWVAVDHSDGATRGYVYLLCAVDRAGPDPADIMFARSTNGGAGWGLPIRVNDDPPDSLAWQWFGTMSVAPDGRIDVVWNDTRNSGAANISEVFYAYSTDAGTTWSPNHVVTPPFDSHVGWPQQNKLGDYYHMASDDAGANLAYAATFNGGQDVYFVRLGDCNGNGVFDGTDVANGTSADLNHNDIPDECEPDCNHNLIPDDLDIAEGTSPDCNGNGVPDECDLADGTSVDLNGDGVPDECPSCTTPQQADLAASGLNAADQFGYAVALSNGVAVVGAPQDDDRGLDAGAAYAFRYNSGDWLAEAKLLASDGVAGDALGFAVAAAGDTILAGAPLRNDPGTNSGAVYVFVYDGAQWTQQAKLRPSGGSAGDQFGCAVAISGNTALLGARGSDQSGDDAGAAYVFVRSGTTWTQQARLLANGGAAGDNFGGSVAVDGDYALVGANQSDVAGTNAGAAFIFHRSGSAWTQTAQLRASDPADSDLFGGSVGLSSDVAIVGAPLASGELGPSAGAAYIFRRSGSSWGQEAKLEPANGGASQNFGSAVSISGNAAAIGAPYDDAHGTWSGAAYAYELVAGQWYTSANLLPSDAAAYSLLGFAVAASADTVIAGAYGEASSAGSAYAFRSFADCNGDNLPDVCDIVAGHARDQNGNGVPDGCELRPGDLNCDGVVNNFDISPFVLAITDPAAYITTYPRCLLFNGDCNGDGRVDNFDITPFVSLLAGP